MAYSRLKSKHYGVGYVSGRRRASVDIAYSDVGVSLAAKVYAFNPYGAVIKLLLFIHPGWLF